MRVSMVAFDDGSEHSLYLDGSPTDHINPDLFSGADLTTAIALSGELFSGLPRSNTDLPVQN